MRDCADTGKNGPEPVECRPASHKDQCRDISRQRGLDTGARGWFWLLPERQLGMNGTPTA
jgi:hypothetical protein